MPHNGSEETSSFGARPRQATAQLHDAEAALREATIISADCRRAIEKRQTGAAEWQLKRVEERIARALGAIGSACDALTIEEIRESPAEGSQLQIF